MLQMTTYGEWAKLGHSSDCQCAMCRAAFAETPSHKVESESERSLWLSVALVVAEAMKSASVSKSGR